MAGVWQHPAALQPGVEALLLHGTHTHAHHGSGMPGRLAALVELHVVADGNTRRPLLHSVALVRPMAEGDGGSRSDESLQKNVVVERYEIVATLLGKKASVIRPHTQQMASESLWMSCAHEAQSRDAQDQWLAWPQRPRA